MHIAIITSNYPSPANPTHGTFVRQFANAVARQGIKVSVIQPVAFHRALNSNRYPYHEIHPLNETAILEVYRPRFISLSTRDVFNKLGHLSPSRFTFYAFTRAVLRTLRKERITPDALYGHFLYLAGAAAVRLGNQLGIPAFPCVGEGELWTVRWFGEKQAKKDLARAAGFIANSNALKQTLIDDLNIGQQSIGVFPNGTDLSIFSPRDKCASRKQFGLPQDRFLVCSVGSFLHKKGIVRVSEAINRLDGVAGVFAGSGPLPPKCNNIAFCGRVSHDEMPLLMSACDVFVLPTLIEGSCNAIVEAMACGLPIISSNGDFNDDLLTDEMSIRVNPMDTMAIRNAIMWLRDDPDLRQRLGKAALARSRSFDVNDRARRILDFMNEQRIGFLP